MDTNWTMNEAVREMKKTPGKYYITNNFGRALRFYMAVEVDGDGKVYQLNPAGDRNGELNDDGWNANAEVMTSVPDDWTME